MKSYDLVVNQLGVDGCGSFYYSKGHHPIEEFLAGLKRDYNLEFAPGDAQHVYGFWGIDGEDMVKVEGRWVGRSALFIRHAPGRGRFPVTMVETWNGEVAPWRQ